MQQHVFTLYQHFLTELEHAKNNPSAQRIFRAVEAYDTLYSNLSHPAQLKLERRIRSELPVEWRLWRRCAESYRRWPECFRQH